MLPNAVLGGYQGLSSQSFDPFHCSCEYHRTLSNSSLCLSQSSMNSESPTLNECRTSHCCSSPGREWIVTRWKTPSYQETKRFASFESPTTGGIRIISVYGRRRRNFSRL